MEGKGLSNLEWKTVNSYELAKCLFTVSFGDKRVLSTSDQSYENPNSVWGRAFKILFPNARNDARDRLFLYRIWKLKRKRIIAHYDELVGKKSKPFPKPSPTPENKDWPPCVCEPFYEPLSVERRIECSQCKRWLHGVCAKIDISDAKDETDFVCGYCKGELEIPCILDETQSSVAETKYYQGTSPRTPPETRNNDNDETLDNEILTGDQMQEDDYPLTSTPEQIKDPQSERSPSLSSITTETSDVEIINPTKDNIRRLSENDSCSDSPMQTAASNEENAELPSDSDESITYSDFKPQKPSTQQSSERPKNKELNSSGSDSDEFSGLFKRSQPSKSRKNEEPQLTKNTTADSKSNQNESPIDVTKVKKEFTVNVNPEEWRKILRLKDNKIGNKKEHYEFVSGFTAVLNRIFDMENKICVLSFEKKCLAEPTNKNKMFFYAYAHCSNETCSAHWRVSVDKCPQKGEKVAIKFRLFKGEMKHFASIPASRKWTGEYKEDARRLLESKLPAAARIELASKADMEAVKLGKLTTLRPITVFQNIKRKMIKEEDLNKDVVKDLALLKNKLIEDFPDKSCPGYLQDLQISPTKIVLYSYDQMSLLFKMQKNGPVSLLLDATGSIVRPLGGVYDSKSVLLYALIVKSPVKGNSPVPITEMITSDHTHTSIYTWLYTFFHKFQKRFSIPNANFGIQKLEIDFSRPMLTSLVRLFTNVSLEVYLNVFWDHYYSECSTQKHVDVFPIHVCRFHVLQAVKRKMRETYKGNTNSPKMYAVLMEWVYGLVRSKDLYSFDRRVKDISVITLNQYLTPSVEKRLQNLKGRTKRGSPPWKDFQIQDQPPNGPFWMRSGFGQYAHSIFSFTEKVNAEVCNGDLSALQPNPFYSKTFADYMRTYFLPYFPLISHMVFDAVGIAIEDDTNNAIENYFGIIKSNIYKQRKHQRASRFVRRQAGVIKGIVNSTTSLLQTDQGSKPFARSKRSSRNYSSVKIGSPSDRHDTSKSNTDWLKGELSPDSNNDSDEECSWFPKATSKDEFKGTNYEKVSPEKQKEQYKKPAKRLPSLSQASEFMSIVPVVKWGGMFEDTNIVIYNTCSIDTTLQILVALNFKIHEMSEFWKQISKQSKLHDDIGQAVAFAEHGNFNSSKTIWIRDVMQVDPSMLPSPGDMRNSEFDSALKFILDLFPVKRIHRCTNNECLGFTDSSVYPEVSKKRRWEDATLAYMRKSTPDAFANAINYAQPYDCPCHCGNARVVQHKIDVEKVPFLLYSLLHDQSYSIREKDLPRYQVLGGRRFKLFAYTCIVNTSCLQSEEAGLPHFIAKFCVGDNRVVFDGLQSRPYFDNRNKNDQVTSVWVVPEEPNM